MKLLSGLLVSLSIAQVAWGDEDDPLLPSFYGLAPAKKGGPRLWMDMEVVRADLTAKSASGMNPDNNSTSAFNKGIDTVLQQATAWLNGGYEFDFGLGVYGKVGGQFPTLIQDVHLSSVLAASDRQGGGIDPYFTYGVGVSFEHEVGPKIDFMARGEFTAGSGRVDNYNYQDLTGKGTYSFMRFEVRAAVGYETELAVPYIGVRYNFYQNELKLDEIGGGPNHFDVKYQFKTPVGLFVGVRNRLGESVLWSAEIGFIDALTLEVGVGLAF